MIMRSIISVFLSLSADVLFGQSFYLKPSPVVVQNCPYNKFLVQDVREHRSNLGFVLGSEAVKSWMYQNEPKIVIFNSGKNGFSPVKQDNQTIADQLFRNVSAMIDNSSGSGELLIQIRKFEFNQYGRYVPKKATCRVLITLLKKSGSLYQEVATMNQLFEDKKTAALASNTSDAINNFLVSNIFKQASTTARYYTQVEVSNLDSVEKTMLAIYNTRHLKDGIYNTYNSFKKQTPENQISAFKIQGDSSYVYFNDSGDIQKELKSSDVFAVVYNGQPYIGTDYGLYPLTRENGNLYFNGQAKYYDLSKILSETKLPLETANLVIAKEVTDKKINQFMIDHSSGSFIRINQLE